MSDVKSKVLIEVQANTAQAVPELNKVTEATNKMGGATGGAQKSFTSFLESAANGFAKFNLAIGGVQTAIGMLNGAVDAAINSARRDALERALPTGSVDRLKTATDGLIARQEVLRLSVRGLTGDFALTEPQMAKVLQASIALEQKGFGPATQIAEKLLDALGPKGVDKLDDFGIALEKTKDHQHDVNAAMDKFNGIINDNPVDERTKSLIQLKNVLIDIGVGIEDIVAKAADGVAWIIKNLPKPSDTAKKAYGGDHAYGDDPRFQSDLHGNTPLIPQEYFDTYGDGSDDSGPSIVGQGLSIFGHWVKGSYSIKGPPKSAMSEEDQRTLAQWRKAHPGKKIPITVWDSLYYRKHGIDTSSLGDSGAPWDSNALDELEYSQAPDSGFGYSGFDDSNLSYLENQQDENAWWNRDRSAGGSYMGGEDKNGPAARAADSMRQLTDQTTLAGGAFNVFQNSFGSAVSAAVDGSDSMAKAFAKASAAGLKALAVEYAVRAIGEGAWAIASLAAQDYKGASLHGAAALKFGLAAAAAGTGSALLGGLAGGSSNQASTSAGGGYTGPSGSGGSSGTKTIIINLGGGVFLNDKQAISMISRAIRDGERQGTRSNDSYSTRFSGG